MFCVVHKKYVPGVRVTAIVCRSSTKSPKPDRTWKLVQASLCAGSQNTKSCSLSTWPDPTNEISTRTLARISISCVCSRSVSGSSVSSKCGGGLMGGGFGGTKGGSGGGGARGGSRGGNGGGK